MLSSELISKVQLVANVPEANATYTSSDILSYANMEMKTALVPKIRSVQENYFLTYVDYPINNTGTYAIPPRAIGQAIARVAIVNGTQLVPVAQTDIQLLDSTTYSPYGNYSFYIQSNKIILSGPVTGNNLRVWYYIKPSKIVLVSRCALITNINGTTVTVSSLPTDYVTNTKCDFVKATGGYECLAIDVTISNVAGLNVTLSSVPSDLEVGDYLCLANTSPFPQIPSELQEILVQRTAMKVLEAQTYTEKWNIAAARLKEMEEAAWVLLTPRADREPKKIVNQNGLFSNSRFRTNIVP